MVEEREPFWSAVHSPFMTRDLTRSDVREIVAKGFQTAGNDRALRACSICRRWTTSVS
jgi:hypothetical protein